MPTTISQSFLRFKENLEISDYQESIVSIRQKGVRKAMEEGIDLIDPYSFLTGSYKRQTLIAPLKEADIDIFFILDPRYYHHYNEQNGGQAGLLDYVKRTLLRSYPKTPNISRNGQAVSISFNDFIIDVVPGFKREGGGFLIPDSINRNWISTNPKKHVEVVSASNQAHNGDLIPLIKMIKAWNKNNHEYFRSFHLEVLILEALKNVKISSFSSGVRYFFDKGRTLVTQKNPDPAGYGDDVGNYISAIDAAAKFQLAYDRAVRAEGYMEQDNVKDAINEWIKIFGNYFPNYG